MQMVYFIVPLLNGIKLFSLLSYSNACSLMSVFNTESIRLKLIVLIMSFHEPWFDLQINTYTWASSIGS